MAPDDHLDRGAGQVGAPVDDEGRHLRVDRHPDVVKTHRPRPGIHLRRSYGSAFGLLHGALYHTVGEPRASLAFGTVLMTATFSLFPLLGDTPPPWRWPKDVIATSISTHIAYVAATDDRLRRSA
jgi:hypothetical protein